MLRGMHGNVRRRFAENARRGCAGFAVIPATERESPNVCKNASRFSRHCAESWSNVRRTMPCLPLPRHSERQRRDIRYLATCCHSRVKLFGLESSDIPFDIVIPLRGMTFGFSHARINSVATLSLRAIPARASPERSRMGAGITFLHRHLEHRERSSQVMCKSSFSRSRDSFTFLGTNVPHYYMIYLLSITDKSIKFIKNLLFERLLTMC